MVPEGFENIVTLDDGTVIEFRLPNLMTMEDIEVGDNEFDSTIAVLGKCVKSVTIEDEHINRKDMTDKEINDFLLDMTSGDFNQLNEKFFSKIPVLKATIKTKREDGTTFTTEVAGLANFF